jgi:predicted DNA binding CopG/RHH family protein
MRKVPVMTTDAEAEAFLDQDLSDLDFSQFKSAQFEFTAKDERINMRLPSSLLGAVKAKAKAAGMPYQRFIRATLEKAVSGK